MASDPVSAIPEDVAAPHEIFRAEVARYKAFVLKVPVVAHSKASSFYRRAVDENDGEFAAIWAQVVRELEVDGYAPDAAGNPGPAVRSHYEGGVLTAGPVSSSPPTSISTTDFTL